MSKKATRRAAREAFPKAKNPPVRRSRFEQRQRPTSGQRRPAGAGYNPRVPRPASIKRALIWGVIMAVIYFAFIQFLWKSQGTTIGNLFIAAASFIIFAAVVYGVDHFKYQRYLKKKGSSK
jgi:hypothetical protein